MNPGAGKYDELCSIARLATEAQGVLLIVLDGNLGSGFSVQVKNPELLHSIPDLLEKLARKIREDLEHSRDVH